MANTGFKYTIQKLLWQLCKDNNGGDKRLDEIMSLVNNKNVNVNLTDDDDKYKRNALHYAAWNGQNGTIDFLLKKGLDLNSTNNDGDNALHEAAYNGQNGTIDFLLKKGLDLNSTNNSGETALQLAVRRGHSETVNFLKKYKL